MLLEQKRSCGLNIGTRTLLCFGHGYSGDRVESCCGLGIDARVTVCFWSTNVLYGLGMDALVTACFGTRTLLWLGHGCSGDGMLFEQACYYGLGMDALVNVCSWSLELMRQSLAAMMNML